MAAEEVSYVKLEKITQGFAEALSSAVLEWLLIFVLFINALFSYLITKFACYCGLQTPCLLCSRLDHVLGDKKVGFYWDMICGNHKSEISSLVLCHAHNKLADVHGMCENCLFSFATINKSNAETYRLLVGKLGEDSEDHNLCSSSRTHCTCCNEPWISRGYAQKLVLTKSSGCEFVDLDVPLSGVVGSYQYSLKKNDDRTLQEVPLQKDRGLDLLSHVGYTKLKITSDTESDVLFSDDDETAIQHPKGLCLKEESATDCAPIEPPIVVLGDDANSDKLIDPASLNECSPASQVQLDVVEAPGGNSVASTAEHGLGEINCQGSDNSDTKAASAALPELISFDEIPSAANDTSTSEGVLTESCVMGVDEDERTAATSSDGVIKEETYPIAAVDKAETNTVCTDHFAQAPNFLDLGDAYKIAVGNRGRQLSGVLAEQWLAKDCSRVSEDLKNLFSQLSATRGFEQSGNDMSPKVSAHSDEFRASDAPNSTAFQVPQKKISLERNESGLESLDGSIVSEIEGESVIDRLKRQIEHDRKSMSALYKELEEERNASAIATNQAMAMITRLQEEKATLHMEALQYLRMMEEQAEYDMEALQKSNDLLADREKDMQDLEAELEFYRDKYSNEPLSENTMESVHLEASSREVTEKAKGNEISVEKSGHDKVDHADRVIGETRTIAFTESAVEIEKEKLRILQFLKKLEQKLGLSPKDSKNFEVANGGYSEIKGGEVCDSEELDCRAENSESGVAEDSRISNEQTSVSLSEGDELVSLRNEVHSLYERLEALEADRCFLERTIKYLRIGDEGLQFIHDIASQLQELRRVGTGSNEAVP
ncbi:myosin-binding protein 1-like isoform X3 [Rhodamnia argentea]|uniref:Myosin-binding protein 1-like isoform X2 n=1 Tax=Rhodamnia argentea TaxID=178133 RepID=A0ABM3HIS6_9MYRT|nr:myosin-binding protein 1-like isoform X2 [Rhodamnia argentea]XP_048136490.1 myosin-binding protein 1-like isoform X3 [Rhodamnia argentea]